MVLIPLLLVCFGLAIVVASADEAIKRLLNLARIFQLSEFVTSFVIAGVIAILPELAIGAMAAANGNSPLGLGLVMGSNIADLTLVIGIIALVAGKLSLNSGTKKHMRTSLLSIIVPVILFMDGELSQFDGAVCILVFLAYMAFIILTRHGFNYSFNSRGKKKLAVEVAVLLASMAVLFFGSSLITDNSQVISESIGLPIFIIGVLVAIGTCIPELSFALRASRNKKSEIGLGNILGNVLADSLLTIGIIAIIHPIKPSVPLAGFSTAIFMALSAVFVYGLSRKGELDREDAMLLLVLYAIFITLQSMMAL